MRRIGTYMNFVVWFCIECDQVNDEIRDLGSNHGMHERGDREELKAH